MPSIGARNNLSINYNKITSGDNEQGKKMGEGGVVGFLEDGLETVRPAFIQEWNKHKHVRGDRGLQPIFIPF